MGSKRKRNFLMPPHECDVKFTKEKKILEANRCAVPWKSFPEILIELRRWIIKYGKFRSPCSDYLVRVNQYYKLLLQRPDNKLFMAHL